MPSGNDDVPSVAHVSPHVLHVADADAFARFGRMLRQLFLALADADVNVSLLTDDARGVTQFVPPSVGAHVLPALAGLGAWRLPSALRARFAEPPHLLHVWGFRPVPALRRWIRRSRVPVLIHAISVEDVHALNRHPPLPQQYVAGICERFCRALGARRRVSDYPVQRLAPGLLLPAARREAPSAERTLGLLCVERFRRDGGLETLFEALARLRDRGIDVQTAVIGGGPGAAAQRAAVAARSLEDRVSLIHDWHVWDEAVGGVDAFVVPRRQTALSLAPLLAMAAGVPVIASADQIAEWFVEDRSAWLFPPGSPVELARLLERLHADRAGAATLGARARAFVGERYRVGPLAQELAALYATVASRQRTLALVKSPVATESNP